MSSSPNATASFGGIAPTSGVSVEKTKVNRTKGCVVRGVEACVVYATVTPPTSMGVVVAVLVMTVVVSVTDVCVTVDVRVVTVDVRVVRVTVVAVPAAPHANGENETSQN
jgi:hypothetical protein